ncbi:MAG TPA: acyl-CoA dehydrogenase family protein [Candidatus Deferrimicrobiaceae bacterium]|nr:acyl-CoA dehydrogenase family protein [Candidatus Deferrimicrobiaceae bacterium]
MDFGLSGPEQAFAREVRAFLRAHPPETFPEDGTDAGYGSGAHSRAFTRALGERGWLSMGWPREHGGQARPMTYLLILLEELAAAGAPFGPLSGCLQVSDSIIRNGSEALQREILPLVARGDATFWQGYSEPDAGSDLLALRTRARLEGDHWVLDGRKIWSSHAGIATYGTVLARTDPESARHRGLTMLVVDNRLPGMDVRPIRSLTGRVYHYEIFMDGVRVPRDWVMGKAGEGFGQLLKGLDTDRFWGRFYKAPFLRRILGLLVEHVSTARAGDPVARRQLAHAAAEIAALRALFYRAAWLIERGLPATGEVSAAKVMADELGQRVLSLGMELLGPYGVLRAGSRWARLRGEIEHQYQTSWGHTLAGGTSEIQRTTIAVRALGLPAEPKARA